MATYRIDISEDEEALGERLVYHAAGLDGVGTGSYIDSLILRDRDTDANGSLEERHYYAQNWRHDVVAIVDNLGRQIEHMRYTPYGIAISIPMADKVRNGLLEQADGSAMAAAVSNYSNNGVYDVRFDNDLDGDIDFTDLSLAVNQSSAIGSDPIGRGVLSSYAHRAGYAGYQWTSAAGLYHVRHRWYDAMNGSWISMDPAGYVDGASLFSYARLNPIQAVDPTGLDIGRMGEDWGTNIPGSRTISGQPIDLPARVDDFFEDVTLREVVKVVTWPEKFYWLNVSRVPASGGAIVGDVFTGLFFRWWSPTVQAKCTDNGRYNPFFPFLHQVNVKLPIFP